MAALFYCRIGNYEFYGMHCNRGCIKYHLLLIYYTHIAVFFDPLEPFFFLDVVMKCAYFRNWELNFQHLIKSTRLKILVRSE